MRIVRWLLLSVLLAANAAFADSSASPDDQYVLGQDSEVQPGVPEGKVTEFVLKDSKVFPGYEHKWWLYVPAQYDGKKPIALMAFQDGRTFLSRDGVFRVPVVLNNLIAKGQIPVMAAVFVDPGAPRSLRPDLRLAGSDVPGRTRWPHRPGLLARRRARTPRQPFARRCGAR